MSYLSGLNIYKKWKRIETFIFSFLSKGAFYQFGHGSRILLPVRIAGENRISIGKDVYIGENSWIQVLDNNRSSDFPTVSIGDTTKITGYCTISAVKSIVIEQKVLIARYAYIADHSHKYNHLGQPILSQGISNIGPVRICEGSWLGQGVVVCPGVTIGKGSVIGANSIVKSNIPDFCVAGGAPAKILHYIKE